MAGGFFSGLQGDGRKRVSFGLTSSFSSKSCYVETCHVCLPKTVMAITSTSRWNHSGFILVPYRMTSVFLFKGPES